MGEWRRAMGIYGRFRLLLRATCVVQQAVLSAITITNIINNCPS